MEFYFDFTTIQLKYGWTEFSKKTVQYNTVDTSVYIIVHKLLLSLFFVAVCARCIIMYYNSGELAAVIIIRNNYNNNNCLPAAALQQL